MRLTVVCSLNRGAKMINATVTLSQTELARANHIEYTWSVTVGEGYKKVKVKNVKAKNVIVKVKNTKVKNVKVKNVKVYKNVKV